MATKKYVSLSKLQTFLDNLNNKFATLSHKHNISDITDYAPITVDSELSSTSINPVQNKVINDEFDAVATSMNALELVVDDKVDKTELQEEISKISQNIVQSDWNQNDQNALDYIKNRTHYQEIEEIEWIPYGTYNFIRTKNAILAFEIANLNPTPIVAGTKYKVTLDGVVKEYVAIQEDGSASFGEDTISEANGNGAKGFVASNINILLPPDQEGEHTLEIIYYNDKPTYHKLDENFIPTMQDEEVVTMLVNKGFVDLVTDNDGDILTNANGDILIL